MPITRGATVPSTAKLLELPQDSDSKLFIVFISSNDPNTGLSWCPDVRAALPYIDTAFGGGNAPNLSIVEVGQRPEWKKPDNFYRSNWNVHNVPTLVAYQRVNGEVSETARLVEDEILDEERLRKFIG